MDTENTDTEATDTEGEVTGTDTGPEDTSAELAALRADLDKWKGLARKHEKASKGKTSTVDLDAAIEAARAEATAQAGAEAAKRVAKAELKAALGKSGKDLLEFVDVDLFITDGDFDAAKAASFIEAAKPADPVLPDLAQGKRDDSDAGKQWTAGDLQGKSAEWIETERKAGRLTKLLGQDN